MHNITLIQHQLSLHTCVQIYFNLHILEFTQQVLLINFYQEPYKARLYSHSSKDALCICPIPGNDLMKERTFPGEVNGAHKFKDKHLP